MVKQDTRPGMPLQEPADAVSVVQTEEIVQREDMTAPVQTISVRRSVAYDGVLPRTTLVEPYPPTPSVMLESDPRPYWSRGPGAGAMLAILVAVIGGAILVFLVASRGDQTAQVTPPAP